MRKILEQIHFENDLAVYKLAKQLIENYKPNSLIVNIGTDSLLYDSVGPMVGSMLKKHDDLIYDIVGTLEEPIDFGNLEQSINHINESYFKNFIIGIDAAISTDAGYISLYKGPIYPGLGAGKKARSIGDVSIIAGVGRAANDMCLFPIVHGCANTIYTAIIEADRYIKRFIV